MATPRSTSAPAASSGTPSARRPTRTTYSGKILRIIPLANPTAPASARATRSRPATCSPRPRTRTNKTLPEIYAMGFRNPFRITVDPTRAGLIGDYGPDAGAANPNRGPQGSVEFNVVTPGNYGWPYCIGNNVPYNDYDFATRRRREVQLRRAGQQLAQQHGPDQPAAGQAGRCGSATPSPPAHPGLGTGGAPTGGPRYHYDANLPPTRSSRRTTTASTSSTSGTAAGSRPRAQRRRRRRSPTSRRRRGDTFQRRTSWSSGPTARSTSSTGAAASSATRHSGIYRIDYVKGARQPVAHAAADTTTAGPLAVQFSSAGSVDPDGTSLTYAWDFDGNGTTDSTAPNPTHPTPRPAPTTSRLTVTDPAGKRARHA